MTTELADYSTIFRSPCLLWCKSCERDRIRASILNYKPHLLYKKSGLEANGLVKPQYCTFLLEKPHILNTSMNIEWLSNDIKHILLIDNRSIIVFHLNMSRGIAYYILYE